MSSVEPPTPELVAEIIAGLSTQGAAWKAFEERGWPSILAGNRITVCDHVIVLFAGECLDDCGLPTVSWVVFGIDDGRLVRVAPPRLSDRETVPVPTLGPARRPTAPPRCPEPAR